MKQIYFFTLAIFLVALAPGCATTSSPPPLPPAPTLSPSPTLLVFVVDTLGNPQFADLLAMKMDQRMEKKSGLKGRPDQFNYRLTPHPDKEKSHWTAGL